LNNIRVLLLEPDKTVEGVQELSFVLKDVRVVFRVDKTFSVDRLKSALNI
jgi:hypothetical protein